MDMIHDFQLLAGVTPSSLAPELDLLSSALLDASLIGHFHTDPSCQSFDERLLPGP